MSAGERLEVYGGGALPAVRRAAHTGWRALLPSWPLVMGLLAFVQTLAHPNAVLGDPDTYLHIAAGHWMFLHHALPAHDPFSYTKAGAPWIAHEWLSEIMLAAVYDVGGWSGLVLLAGACFAAGAALLTRLLLRYCDPFSTLIAVLLAGLLTLAHLLARPHLLALPLLVLWCGALFRARDDGAAPPLLLLPVITLWANLHASFMFGLALAGFLAGEAVLCPAPGASRRSEARRWGMFFLAAALAALCTPNGIAGIIQPFRLMAMPALAHILEWQGANFQDFQPLELWLLGFAGLGFATGLTVPPARLVLVLGLCHLSLQHIRYTELLGFVGPLALAASLGADLAEKIHRAPPSALAHAMLQQTLPARAPALLAVATGAVLLSLPLLLQPITRTNNWMTPATALAAAAARGLLKKPVFNSYSFGGYLIFRKVPTFVDGRAELYGNAFLADQFEAQNDRRKLAALLHRFHVAWALLSPQDGAALLLDGMAGWRRIYRDRYAVVDVRAPGPSQ
ncbi:MAG TPA: hypothetical protein VJ770_08150 [Stellaceae bacterium]|nr:hypothetical protein [Stellaceae bacterium]